MLILVVVACYAHLLLTVNAYENSLSKRLKTFSKHIAAASMAVGVSYLGSNFPVQFVQAAGTLLEPKQTKLSNEAIARIVQDDINIRQALVS